MKEKEFSSYKLTLLSKLLTVCFILMALCQNNFKENFNLNLFDFFLSLISE